MNEERIEQLISGHLGNRLKDEEKAELADWLDEAADHRVVFRQALELEYALSTQLQGGKAVDEDELLQTGKTLPFPAGFRKWEHLGIAALLMLCLTLTWLLWNNARESNVAADLEAIAESMAKLNRVSPDAVFHTDHEMPNREGSYLGKGWMLLDQGTIEIVFHSGATVEVTGPATFGIDTPMRGFLDFGEVSVHAPEEARDFVVGTASMEVVDLGTRFEMSVDQDSSEAKVTVTEGLVDLHLGGEGTQRRIKSLPAGLSAHIDSAGEVVSIAGDRLDSEIDSSGLLAHWSLDHIAEDGSIEDSSGNARSAVFRGRADDVFVEGAAGRAIDLSAGSYIDISDHIPTLTEVNSLTFAAWVRDAKDIVFSFSDGTPRNRVQFELHGSLLLYGWQQGATFDAIQGRMSSGTKEQWHHVAVAISGGKVALYHNGRLLNSESRGQKIGVKTLTLVDLENPVEAYVGLLPSNHAHKPQRLGGQIDDVQIYRQALDAEAIAWLVANPGDTWRGGDWSQ